MDDLVIAPPTGAERDWAAELLAASEPWITLRVTLEQCREACRDPEYLLSDKVIKIPPPMMMSSWMGSDFTNDDLVKEFTFEARSVSQKPICHSSCSAFAGTCCWGSPDRGNSSCKCCGRVYWPVNKDSRPAGSCAVGRRILGHAANRNQYGVFAFCVASPEGQFQSSVPRHGVVLIRIHPWPEIPSPERIRSGLTLQVAPLCRKIFPTVRSA